MPEKQEHRVVWKDHLDISNQWALDIRACSESFGTPRYVDMVRRFRNNIPNIHKGPELRDIITKYVDEVLEIESEKLLKRYKQNYPLESRDSAWVIEKEKEIEMIAAENLYIYMFQLLEDKGFGFYKSNIQTENVSLDD